MTSLARKRNIAFTASLLSGLYLLLLVGAPVHAQQCAADGVALQVLGSGGPIADDARASSSYLLWHKGRARVVVDLGSGAVLRYAESGASFADLDAILLSHLHADHSADLPAFLKSGYFAHRQRDLLIAGPSAGGSSRVWFPALDDYLQAMFKARTGAYGYLSGYLDGSDGLPKLQVQVVADAINDKDAAESIVYESVDLRITARRVGHGPVPAAAYRVELDGHAVVFAGDQDGRGNALVQLAEDADLLVLHMPIPQHAPAGAKALHAEPQRLGEQASAAGVGSVVLSHFMARSLRNADENTAALKREFGGVVHLAEDLVCIPF